MIRCRETAGIAMGGTAVEIIVDDRLREANFGDWEGLSFADVSEKDPAGADRWKRFNQEFAFPEGERLVDFMERVNAVADMLSGLAANAVAVFTHGGVIRFMLCRFLDIEARKYVAFDIGYATAVVLTLHRRRATLADMINPEDMSVT
jgi:broad specificity phosphatase PhoE